MRNTIDRGEERKMKERKGSAIQPAQLWRRRHRSRGHLRAGRHNTRIDSRSPPGTRPKKRTRMRKRSHLVRREHTTLYTSLISVALPITKKDHLSDIGRKNHFLDIGFEGSS